MTNSLASILAIDVGTSSLKAVLYSTDGQILGTAIRRYSYRSDRPGWAEGDPEGWWQALRDSLADLQRQGFPLEKLDAISFTGQMHTAVLLDSEDRPIPPTILWLDRRAANEAEELREKLGLPPYQINSTYTLPKLLWLHRHRPDVMARVRKILWPKDYLRFRLTGELCTDLTEAGGAALLDWDRLCWAVDRLELVGLNPDVLPPIRPPDADAGRIRPEIADSLGLSQDTKVVVGMGDVAALIGGAPPKPGRVVCSLGSSSMVFMALSEDQRVEDPANRLYTYPLLPPYRLFGGVSSTTGAALMWVYEKVCPGREQGKSFDDCLDEALRVEPGADGVCFIPYLAGERSPFWNDELRGGFYGLRLTHDWRHLLRAVMEGVGYSLRYLLDIYLELDLPVEELVLAAGGAEARGWPQIIADVCQRDVLIYTGGETVTRVLYALCQAHLGRAGFEEGLLRTFGEPAVIRHRPELQTTYDTGYRTYRSFVAFALKQAESSQVATHRPLGKEQRYDR